MKKFLFKARIFLSDKLFKLAFFTLPDSDYKFGMAKRMNDYNWEVRIQNEKA